MLKGFLDARLQGRRRDGQVQGPVRGIAVARGQARRNACSSLALNGSNDREGVAQYRGFPKGQGPREYMDLQEQI